MSVVDDVLFELEKSLGGILVSVATSAVLMQDADKWLAPGRGGDSGHSEAYCAGRAASLVEAASHQLKDAEK